MNNSSPQLKKVFTATTLSIYGIGSILGAGIYTIIGEVASVAGERLWISFIIAMGIALLTGLSYAELGRRYPESGAESLFSYKAFNNKLFSAMMGWLVLCASIVSVATLSHAFVGYLNEIWGNVPAWPVLIVFISFLGLINLWGIQESSRANMVATFIEFSGLILVLVAGFLFFTQGDTENVSVLSSKKETEFSWMAILTGVSFAFFAFIGFEDIVNVAEEVKKPERNLPIGILVAGSVAGILYITVAWISASLVPAPQLASSHSPLLEVIKESPLRLPSTIFTIIALFAVSNTALLNSITASRLLYGMSKQSLLPKILSTVHSKRKTPYIATLFVIPTALLLALGGSLGALAGTTTLILLSVFLCVNLSLVVIKLKEKKSESGFKIPLPFPILGVLSTGLILFFVPQKSQMAAGVIIALGLLILSAYKYFKK